MSAKFRRWSVRRRALVLAALACAAAGCAGLPRIDPSGERILIWPKDQPRIPSPVASLPTLPSAAVQAPPVLTDPVFPAPPAGIAAPATTIPVLPASTAAAAIATPTDRLSITPSRILAPVGSEVVLKASICTTDGYTLADEKIDWQLGRNGVGEFVDVGGKGLFHPEWIPLFRGKRVDNYLAQGYTATGPMCVDRGTPDPTDDVNVNRGDAWISVTAAHEGTSYVTAIAPGVESWDARRSSATIYWVDVQWTFPPGEVSGSGRSQTLTTTLTRRTDGTPIEGWIVRYDVVDGGTVSGGAAGTSVEVRTDAQGRASVDATPTAAGAPTSRIDMQIVRPPGFGGDQAPRLVIGNGTTLIRWNDSQPYLSPEPASPPTIPATPPVTAPPASQPPTTIPFNPPSTTPPPPIDAAPRRPSLETEIRGPTTAQVGGEVRYEAVISNVGTGPATGVVVTDDFQAGLSHLMATRGEQRIEYAGLGTLQPGERKSAFLTFQVNAAGELCHDVTVTCAEGVSAPPKRACLTATQPAPVRRGRLEATMQGPEFAVVGEPTTFAVTIRNSGDAALTNVEILEEYPTEFFRLSAGNTDALVVGGTIRRRIDRLEQGQSRRFEVECRPIAPATQVQTIVTAQAETDPPSQALRTSDEAVLEIKPRRDAAPVPGPGPGAVLPPAGGVGGATLDVFPSFFAGRTVRSGTRTTCQVTVQNLSDREISQVTLLLRLPAQLAPDLANAQAPPGAQVRLNNGVLEFSPILSLRPREEVTYQIPVNVNEPGVVEVTARALSADGVNQATRSTTLEITSL